MAKRWTQRPEGSTWGDWGDDDELGRINLLTPEKVLEGVREVQNGETFCLSLPLDYPGGTALNQRRYPPRLAPTEDMQGNPEVFYNALMREMREGDDTFYDVWADDQVTLWLQYSTQWDCARARGCRVRRRRRRRRRVRLLQRLPRRRRPRRPDADRAR